VSEIDNIVIARSERSERRGNPVVYHGIASAFGLAMTEKTTGLIRSPNGSLAMTFAGDFRVAERHFPSLKDISMIPKKIHLAVLMGGPSSEHEVSLMTGQNVIKNLNQRRYQVKPIKITQEGIWVVNGQMKKVKEALAGIDLVFNALHGEYGEDGQVQAVLDYYGVPYTGSGALASALAMDKVRSRQIFREAGLATPFSRSLAKQTWPYLAENIFSLTKCFQWPLVVKPTYLGSSVGVSIVRNKENLVPAIRAAFQPADQVLLEEYIQGQEATCGLLENFQGEKISALPVTEIIPPAGHFFDEQVKYDGQTEEITPARFKPRLFKKIQMMAKKAHQALGCQGYSRADFIIKMQKDEVYILEVNTLPGLTKASLLPQAAQAAGLKFPQLLDKIIKEALKRGLSLEAPPRTVP